MHWIAPGFANWLQAGLSGASLLAETQAVMALRVAGFAGLRPLPDHEALRMTAEKPAAFARALADWHQALLTGADLSQQALAYERSLHAAAQANRQRLTRPEFP